MSTDELPRRTTSLASSNLGDALWALDQSADPLTIYKMRGFVPRDNWSFYVSVAESLAPQVWRQHLRHPVLFAALAAEGYVNEFLAGHLSRSDLKSVDRLSTVDKYLFGPQIAIGQCLFSRDDAVVEPIKRLFQLRNKLAHPQPGYGPNGFPLDPAWDDDYAPSATIPLIRAVAEASEILAKNAAVRLPEDSSRIVAILILGGQPVLDSFIGRNQRCPAPPEQDAEAEYTLFEQLGRYRSGQWVDPSATDVW